MTTLSAGKPDKALWVLLGLFGLFFSLFLVFHAIQPVSDTDFWWHLKSGEMMVQNKGFLQTDPFTFSAEGEPTSRESLILKSYWLWEVTAYGLYAILGFKGIFLLNLLTIGAIAITLSYRMQRHAVPWGIAAPLMTASFVLFRGYHLERPQIVSFLFAAILMGFLIEIRQGGRFGWKLPAVMCLWSNLHGGFVVGDIMLGCFAVGAVIQYRNDLPRMKPLLLWVLAGVGTTILNPAGWLAFAEVFNFVGSPLQQGVIEFKGTWVEFGEGNWLMGILWGLIGLYGVGVALSRRIYWPEVLTALFLAYFSVRYVRNVAFFSIAMLPAIGLAWKDALRQRDWAFLPILGAISLGLSTLFLLWSVTPQWKYRQTQQEVATIYPEQAIEFIQKTGLQGRMFNSYEYGGYLLWRLAPKVKIFIDGRGINTNVFYDYEKISFASHTQIDGRPQYQSLLDHYQIDYVIQPIYDGYGNVQPLMKVLLKNDEWHPIYLDNFVYILARDNAQNHQIITTYSLSKSDFNNRLFLIYDYLRRSYPQQIGFRVARTGMLIFMGRYEEAKAEIIAMNAESPNEKMLGNLTLELSLLAGRINRPSSSN